LIWKGAISLLPDSNHPNQVIAPEVDLVTGEREVLKQFTIASEPEQSLACSSALCSTEITEKLPTITRLGVFQQQICSMPRAKVEK
jgi:hypothetical protein